MKSPALIRPQPLPKLALVNLSRRRTPRGPMRITVPRTKPHARVRSH